MLRVSPYYLTPRFFRNENKEKSSSIGAIQLAVRLGETLRMLAGISYLNQIISWE